MIVRWSMLMLMIALMGLTVALSAPAAYALAKLRPKGGGALSFILLIAQMIPAVIMAMGFYAIYLNLGLLESVPGLILADSTIAVPFGVLIFTAFMSGIPEELISAAKIDGAGQWRTFRSIVMPVSRNSIVTVSLFAFLWAWSDFIFASSLDSGGSLQPITMGIYRYIGNNNQEWNAIMATAVVASVPAAKTVNIVIGAAYLLLGIVGFFIANTPANVLALNTPDHFLHLASAIVLLAVGLSTDRATARRAVSA